MSLNRKTGVVTAAALLLAAGTAGAAEYNASVVYGHHHPLAETGYVAWARELEKRTGGAIQFRVFFRNVLLPIDASLSGISDGVAHVGTVDGAEVRDEIPAAAMLARLSFGYTDYFVTALASTDIAFNHPEIQAQWKNSGVVFAGGYSTPPARLICVVPVTEPGDLKGKRIRVTGPVHDLWARSVGANPVEIPFRKALAGMKTGAADCAVGTTDDIFSLGLWDVAKHATLLDLGVRWTGAHYVLNAGFWKALAPDQRRILLDTIAEYVVKSGRQYLARADESLAEASKQDVSIHQPSQELAASIREFGDGNVGETRKLGKEELGIADPDALIQSFTATVEKWRKLLNGVDRNDETALIRLIKTEIYDKIDVKTYGID